MWERHECEELKEINNCYKTSEKKIIEITNEVTNWFLTINTHGEDSQYSTIKYCPYCSKKL